MTNRPSLGTGEYWIAVGMIWSLLALLSVGQTALYLANRGDPVPWQSLVTTRLADWYTCALFLPPLVWLARRFPIEHGTWRRRVPVFLVVSVACTIAKCVIWVPVRRALGDGYTTLRSVLSTDTWSELLIFWAVLGMIHALEFYRRSEERRTELTRARLSALSAQLQPHFLFNTLSVVGELTHVDADAADAMLGELAELLRATLEFEGDADICVRDEMALLERYIALMRRRYGDRLTVAIDVAPDAHAAMLPPFVLQPLVENAFEHGVSHRPGPVSVHIGVAVDAARLTVVVEDDGPGQTAAEPVERIGLTNTRQRLEHRYGGDHRFQLQLRPGGGARTMLAIPFVPCRAGAS